MTYRELQAALKAGRTQGLDVQVKLNASFDTLQAEYNRLNAITTEDSLDVPQPQQVMTTDSFNEWVGLPYQQTTQQPSCGNEPTTKQPSLQLEVPQYGNITLQLGGNIKEPTLETTVGEGVAASEQIEVESDISSRVEVVNNNNLPQNEPFKERQNSQNLVKQEFQSIQSTLDSNIYKTDFESPESLQSETLAMTLNDSPNSPYWIDDSELGHNLEYTQAQALRNLESSLNWLLRLPGRLKAFAQGVREGLRNAPLRQQVSLKQRHVIPIERSYRLPNPLTIPRFSLILALYVQGQLA